MDSAENGYKGLTVGEPHSCTGEKQVQTEVSSNNGANKEQPRGTGAATREQGMEKQASAVRNKLKQKAGLEKLWQWK